MRLVDSVKKTYLSLGETLFSRYRRPEFYDGGPTKSFND